jgi:hypothetical protein
MDNNLNRNMLALVFSTLGSLFTSLGLIFMKLANIEMEKKLKGNTEKLVF